MLPVCTNIDEYRVLRRDPDAQRPAITAIAERHGLSASELAPFPTGTQLVWGTRASVIKLFVPLWIEDVARELALLEHLVGTDLPVPQLEARGELEGWPYVVMSRLGGDRIGDTWPSLSNEEQVRLARAMGETMARVGALPTAGLGAFTTPQAELLAERLPRLLKDQRDRGGDDALDAQLQRFLAELPDLAPADSVLLHADLTDDHFLVIGTDVVGLIDFADAFVGPWTYEFAAPVGFLTHGRPAALRALCEGYGVSADADLLRAIRSWLVLHRYSHVKIMMREVGTTSLDEFLGGASAI